MTPDKTEDNMVVFGDEAIEKKKQVQLKVIRQTMIKKSAEHLHFILLLKNNHDQPVSRPEVKLSLYDSKKQLLSKARGLAMRSVLYAGEVTPVRIVIKKDKDLTSHRVETSAELLSGAPQRTILKISAARLKQLTEQRYLLKGNIENAENYPVKRVFIIALLYDEKERIIAMNHGQLSEAQLAAKASAQFEIEINLIAGRPVKFKLDYEADSHDEKQSPVNTEPVSN